MDPPVFPLCFRWFQVFAQALFSRLGFWLAAASASLIAHLFRYASFGGTQYYGVVYSDLQLT